MTKKVKKTKKNGIADENFVDEKVIVPSISLKQRDRNTDEVYLSYSSPKLLVELIYIILKHIIKY